MKIRFAIPLLAAALTFSVSACGSDSGDSASGGGGSTSSEGPTMSQEEAEKELKERGYELKENEDGTTTVTGGGSGSQVTAKQLERFKKNAECLRGKGYDMPTPTAENPLVAPKGQYDQNKFNQDSMECAQQLQQQGG